MDIVDRIFNLVDKNFREQRDFAAAMQLTPSIVSEWRRRKSASYVKRLPEIAKALGTTTEYLLTGAETSIKPGKDADSSLSDAALAVAHAYEQADEKSRAMVRLALGVDEDLPIAARGGHIAKKPSLPNADTLDRLSQETQQAADLENDQY